MHLRILAVQTLDSGGRRLFRFGVMDLCESDLIRMVALQKQCFNSIAMLTVKTDRALSRAQTIFGKTPIRA